MGHSAVKHPSFVVSAQAEQSGVVGQAGCERGEQGVWMDNRDRA